ncbi:MAG: hypothetical protein JOY73_08765 [Actinobacteria bacterium]|nr:hypothetical protein [Actinomycetota bacterium]
MAKKKAAGKAAVPTEHWKPDPDEHDFPAAHDFLTLVATEQSADALVDALKNAQMTERKAKDLLRACRLQLLPRNNVHVADDLAKVAAGGKLSPVLLVRGRATDDVPLVIADGYHRVCASWYLDEDADIPCRIVDFA